MPVWMVTDSRQDEVKITGPCPSKVRRAKRVVSVTYAGPEDSTVYLRLVIFPTISSVAAIPVLLRCCTDQEGGANKGWHGYLSHKHKWGV